MTEAIVNELSQQLENENRRSLKRQKRHSIEQNSFQVNSQQVVFEKNKINNDLNDQNSIPLIENNNNNVYTSLIAMSTNEKVTTISINSKDSSDSSDVSSNDAPHQETEQNHQLRMAFFLSIAYASNIGGTGTLTGTGPNLVLQGIMDEYYPHLNDLSFGRYTH